MGRIGINPVLTTLMLVVLAVGSSLILYAWVSSSVPKAKREEALEAKVKLEAYSITPNGGLILYVRNIGSTRLVVDAIYLEIDGSATLVRRGDVVLEPGEVERIVVDSFTVRRAAGGMSSQVSLKLASEVGVEASVLLPTSAFKEAVKRKPPLIGLVAYPSSSRAHWVILDYSQGSYILYGDYGPGISEATRVAEGTAPVLTNVDEYTISETWVPWDQRPVDSPVLIVVNPTKAHQDWVFTWHDPHGTFRFYLEALEGDVETDFLIFWEDIYYPPTHPRVDDWKDHVVRITVFTNGTYRIAVYLAKGGYMHKFMLGVTEPYETAPQQSERYTKPFGAYWSNVEGGYYRAMEDKIFLVNPK